MFNFRFSRVHAPLLGTASLAAAAALLALTTGTAAHAQTVYLVGADYYSSGTDGTDQAPAAYLDDTNTGTDGTSTFALSLNGTTYAKGIAIALANGANNFTFVGDPTDPGTNAGIGLFFSTSPVSYNPTSNARTPDLNYATNVGAGFGGDFTPAAGVQVANYIFGGTSTANGLASLGEGTMTVSVSNFTTTHSSTGSFVINTKVTGAAAAAPEPGSVALLATSLLPVAGLVVRRRRVVSA